jgi:hypothetical protein
VPERYCDACRTSGSYAEIPAKAIRSVFASEGGKSQTKTSGYGYRCANGKTARIHRSDGGTLCQEIGHPKTVAIRHVQFLTVQARFLVSSQKEKRDSLGSKRNSPCCRPQAPTTKARNAPSKPRLLNCVH